MITVERRVEVRPQAPDVFAFLADFTHTEQWDPGTVRTTRIDDGPLGEGTRFHNVSEFRGRRTELDYRLVRFEPHSRLTFTGENATVTATDDLALAPSADGTVITYRAHFAFKRWARLAEPFLRRGFEPIADATAAQLKRTLDALAQQPPGATSAE